MIELTNTTEQTVEPGQSLVFNEVILSTGCGECHRRNTGSVKMRAKGIYDVEFSANISGETAGTPVQLAFSLGEGAVLPETTMISTPAAANDFNNVSTGTFIRNCCGDYDRVTVTNTGTVAVIVGANPVFRVKRVS